MKQILMTMVCIAVSAIALAQEDDDWTKKVLDSVLTGNNLNSGN